MFQEVIKREWLLRGSYKTLDIKDGILQANQSESPKAGVGKLWCIDLIQSAARFYKQSFMKIRSPAFVYMSMAALALW